MSRTEEQPTRDRSDLNFVILSAPPLLDQDSMPSNTDLEAMNKWIDMEVAKELSSFANRVMGIFIPSKSTTGEPISARLVFSIITTLAPEDARNISEMAQQSLENSISVLSIFGCYGLSKAFLLSPNIFLCSTILSSTKTLTERFAASVFGNRRLPPHTDNTLFLVKGAASTLTSFEKVGVVDSSQLLSLTSSLVSGISKTLRTVSFTIVLVTDPSEIQRKKSDPRILLNFLSKTADCRKRSKSQRQTIIDL